MTAFLKEITIATGQRGGLYLPLGRRLAAEIERRLRVKVRIVKTKGSLENLLRLRGKNVDFALYQPGTLEALRKHDPSLAAEAEEDVKNRAGLSARPAESARVAFVANLYSQPAHFIVRRGSGIESPADLKKDSAAAGSTRYSSPWVGRHRFSRNCSRRERATLWKYPARTLLP